MQAVSALREAGCEVKGLVAIFTYGFEIANDNFKNAKCNFETLTNYEFLIEQALKQESITSSDLDSLKEWRDNPSTWMVK